jgi:hypothetical protein
MAANPKSPVAGSDYQPFHVYHAEAYVLSGHLKHPVEQPIEPYARVIFEKTRRDGHIKQSAKETTLEGLISFKAGHTRASGTKIEKKDLWGNDHSGWVTLSTSVLESLNVFEVVTTDRVVAQVSTEHPMKDGKVPKVTFLGTRFENLRVGGFLVEVELDLGICGDKPEGDKPYLQERAFLDRVQSQCEKVAGAKSLPESLAKQYDAKIAQIDDLRKRGKGRGEGESNGRSQLQCSLVKSIGPIPIPGVRTFGNIIFIPDFGTISLAEVEVGTASGTDHFSAKVRTDSPSDPSDSHYFKLNMLNIQMGCIGGGNIIGPVAMANGHGSPGGTT